MAVAMFALYFIIYEIFTVEICMTFTLTLTFKTGKAKAANGKPMYNFLFDCNGNVVAKCYRLRDIRVEMCMTLTLTMILNFRIGQMQIQQSKG